MVSSSPTSKDEIEMGNILLTDDTSFSSNPDLSSSTCAVDLNPLFMQTEKTQRLLKDHTVLLNPEKLKRVLNKWVTELNLTLLAYHGEICLQQREKMSSEAAAGLKEGRNLSKDELDNQKNVEKENDKASGKTEAWKGKDLGSNVDPEMNNNKGDPSSPQIGSKAGSGQDKNGISSHSTDPNELIETKGRDEVADPGVSKELEKGDGVGTHSGSDPDADPRVFTKYSTNLESMPGSPKENSPKLDISKKSSSQFSNSLNSPASSEGVSEKAPQSVEASSGDKPQGSNNKGRGFADAEDDSEVDLCIDWSQVCHVKDPFQLSPQQHMTVSSLVSRCLECGCFGNAGAIFPVHTQGPRTISAKDQASKEVPSSFRSFKDADSSLPSQAERICNQKAASRDPDSIHSHHSSSVPDQLPSPSHVTQDSHLTGPAVNGEMCEAETTMSGDSAEMLTVQCTVSDKDEQLVKEEEQHRDPETPTPVLDDSSERDKILDKERALFVRLYFHFIPHRQLRGLLAGADGKWVYATWCAVITCCQGNVVSLLGVFS